MNKTMCKTFAIYLKNAPFFGDAEDEAAGAAQPGWLQHGWLQPGWLQHSLLAVYAAQLRLWAHGYLCKSCAAKKRRLLAAERVLKTAFLPPAPDCADAVMAIVLNEDAAAAKNARDWGSFRGWIAAGVGLALSLLTVYVNGSFVDVAQSRGGVSYLLALALIIGGAITVYSALFIGSHMDALCKKFGLD